jgi:peroxiredoxin family protein
VMRNKKVDSLESLIESARSQGVKMIACQMSMDVMGLKKQEMMDGIEIAGVANYLSAAEKADTNLFV